MILYGSGTGIGRLPDACDMHRGLAGIDGASIQGFPTQLPGAQGIEEW